MARLLRRYQSFALAVSCPSTVLFPKIWPQHTDQSSYTYICLSDNNQCLSCHSAVLSEQALLTLLSVLQIKVETKPWKIALPSRNIEIELTTVQSNYHVEMNPSDVGNQDRHIVQEVIKVRLLTCLKSHLGIFCCTSQRSLVKTLHLTSQ